MGERLTCLGYYLKPNNYKMRDWLWLIDRNKRKLRNWTQLSHSRGKIHSGLASSASDNYFLGTFIHGAKGHWLENIVYSNQLSLEWGRDKYKIPSLQVGQSRNSKGIPCLEVPGTQNFWICIVDKNIYGELWKEKGCARVSFTQSIWDILTLRCCT